MKDDIGGFNCLYYPFSRLLDGTVLKHLLLIFDSVTFIDEAESEEHRRYLLWEMSRLDDEVFSEYEKLQDDYAYLYDEKTITLIDPKRLPAYHSPSAAIAVTADLEDDAFVNLANQPAKYGLPYRPHYAHGKQYTGRPTWQIFQGKIAQSVLDRLESDASLASHVLVPGNPWQSWTLTYEAGSAIALNYYLEASDNLQLVPVTTSRLHHQLVLRKLKRAFSSPNAVELLDSNDRERLRASLGYGEAVKLFREIVPPEALRQCSLKDIIKFRRETGELRRQCVNEINATLRAIDADPSKVDYDAEVVKAFRNLRENLELSEKKILDIRDKVLPGAAKAIMYGAAGGGTVGALASFLAGLSPSGVLAASALTVSAALLKEATELWAEFRKEKRARSNAVSYLAKMSKL